jgi:hypothetical protein
MLTQYTRWGVPKKENIMWVLVRESLFPVNMFKAYTARSSRQIMGTNMQKGEVRLPSMLNVSYIFYLILQTRTSEIDFNLSK